MSVHAKKERPIDFLLFAVVADRLSNCEDVPLVERPVKSGFAMTGRSEDNLLSAVTRVRLQGEIGPHKFWHIHQNRGSADLPAAGLIFTLQPRGVAIQHAGQLRELSWRQFVSFILMPKCSAAALMLANARSRSSSLTSST